VRVYLNNHPSARSVVNAGQLKALLDEEVQTCRTFSRIQHATRSLVKRRSRGDGALGAVGNTGEVGPRPGRNQHADSGFRNAEGKADALLFVRPNGFPDDDSKAVDTDEAPIDPKTMSAQIVFKGVPRGFAAVTVLHDENMNRKMDKNFIGIPKEGYGTSNNPRKASHNPSWDEAKFQVNRPQETIQIRLIYW
jgi:uncharacterized protein (DUF2141 family)